MGRRGKLWASSALGACLLALGLAAYVRSQLPPIYTLADYRPPQASTLFADDGTVLGTFATERRTVVPYAQIPTHVVHAFLAAEDAAYFRHEGIDWPGVARAIVKNLRPGAHLQGASTITQQTVKALILGPERSLWRKVREALLARRLEQMLGKDAILAIYLNQIYFGSGAWGVEQAALTYFGKGVAELDVAEAALLASAPKNPRRYTLRGDLTALKARQRYVLRQMQAHGWVTPQAAAAAANASLPRLPPERPIAAAAASYVEHARRLLTDQLGERAVHEGGLAIYLGLRPRHQMAAQTALRQGAEDVARRHGYPGAARRLDADQLRRKLTQAHAAWDRAPLAPCLGCAPARRLWDFGGVRLLGRQDARWTGALGEQALATYARAEVPVLSVHRARNEAIVDLGDGLGRLPLQRMRWARPFAPETPTPLPRWVGEVLHPGDFVAVEIARLPTAHDAMAEVALVPPTRLEGAAVAIDPHTRLVTALLGSVRPEAAAGFNRAIQARRQPGSAFKPIIYAAGLLVQAITPATLCNDAPISITDPYTGVAWRPENYEGGRYDGPITYRQALAASKNTCSVRLLQQMGPQQAISVAHALGIGGALPENLTLALGTGELTPTDLTNAMASLAAGGLVAPPRFVRRVVAPDGTELVADAVDPGRQALPPEVAYVLTDMLRGVVDQGTARRARMLGRPLAGKTGTSQAARDVWFTGYAPDLAATCWLGFDDNASLGRITGGSAALPAWIRLMGTALADAPVQDFIRPPGVVSARVDPRTGAASQAPDAIDEVFVAGTEPAQTPPHLPSIFLEDNQAQLPAAEAGGRFGLPAAPMAPGASVPPQTPASPARAGGAVPDALVPGFGPRTGAAPLVPAFADPVAPRPRRASVESADGAGADAEAEAAPGFEPR